MALFLISLGLYDKNDMSIKAFETAKKCNKLYIEKYTSYYNTSTKELSKFIGKDIIELIRYDVENKSKDLIKEAKNNDIGLLIIGDALSATTHSALLLEAKALNIKVNVIHGSSILTAVGETGLFLYKFGKTTTIPFNNKNIETPYDILKENKDMHTLFLLDIKDNKYMTINEALSYLLAIEEKRKENLIDEDTKIVICSALGSKNAKIKYGKIKDLIKVKFNKFPQCVIIPGELHFFEEEFLKLYKV